MKDTGMPADQTDTKRGDVNREPAVSPSAPGATEGRRKIKDEGFTLSKTPRRNSGKQINHKV